MSYSGCSTDHTNCEKCDSNDEGSHEVDITNHWMILVQESNENQIQKLLSTDADSIQSHEAIEVAQQRI